MRIITTTLLALLISCIAYAGGDPEHVSYPEGYKTEFTQYDTRNRINGKQLAVLYANKTAIDSATNSKLADGSKIVMEIYKIKLGEDGKAITGTDGLFEKGKFAAVAIMEKRSNWDAIFDASSRAGDWGFALYNTDGTAKENKLTCASCHTPMPDNDYLFSHASLIEFVK